MIHISFGENCLIDYLLEKYNLKKESYIFGSVRTNIEYNMQIIFENFENLLNKKFLYNKKINNNSNVVKNSCYKTKYDIYNTSISNEFEFTHHDVINNKNHINSFIRKIKRFQDILNTHNTIILWYHFRYSITNNIEILINLYKEFEIYLTKTYKCLFKFVIITQIPENLDPKYKFEKKNNIYILYCYDKYIWGGNDNWNATSFMPIFDFIFNKFNILEKI
jgi:hypothetical protein